MKLGYATLAVVGIAALYYYGNPPSSTPTAVTPDQKYTPLTELDYEFYRFVSKHGRSYATQAELAYRQQVFQENLAYIQAKNAENGLSYSLGVNKFADMTNEEFRKRLGRKKATAHASSDYKVLDDSNLPDFVDWRQKGAVNPV